jgi:D-methionine transport system substrate-binding protein
VRRTVPAVALIAGLGLALTACGSDTSSDSGTKAADSAGRTLVVGATAVPAGEVLDYIQKNLAEKAGLDLEVKEFILTKYKGAVIPAAAS